MESGLPLKKPPGHTNPTPPPPPQQPSGPRKPFWLLAVACGLFYAWFEPKLPSFHFRPFELDKFKVNLKPDGTGSLNTKAIVRVEAKNPNDKLDIYYGDTVITLTLDEDIQFGSGSLPGFVQPTNNVTILKFELSKEDQFIYSSSGSRIKNRMNSDDAEVNVAVKTKVGIGIGNVKIVMLPVNVNCGGIKLKQVDQENVSPKCSFKIV